MIYNTVEMAFSACSDREESLGFLYVYFNAFCMRLLECLCKVQDCGRSFMGFSKVHWPGRMSGSVTSES